MKNSKIKFLNMFFCITLLVSMVFICFGFMNSSQKVFATGETLSISLVGNDKIYVFQNTPYQEFGATATDTIEGDLTDNIVIDSSSVDTSALGTYYVTYSITNSQSDTKEVTRTVVVFAGAEDENSKSNYAFGYVIKLQDDSFLATGNSVVKFDNNLNKIWEYTVNHDNKEFVNAMELESGDLLICEKFSTYNSFSGTTSGGLMIYLLSRDGEPLKSEQLNYNTYGTNPMIYKVDSSVYIICEKGFNYYIVNYSQNDTGEGTFVCEQKHAYVNSLSEYSVVINGNIYFYARTTSGLDNIHFYKYLNIYEPNFYVDINMFDFHINNILFESDDNYIYVLVYSSQGPFLYKFDYNFNEIKKITLNYLFNDFSVGNDWIVIKRGSTNFLFYDKNLNYSHTIILNKEVQSGSFYFDGKEIINVGSVNHYSGIVKSGNISWIEGLSDIDAQIYINNDYRTGVKINTVGYENAFEIDVDNLNVNTSKVGNYQVYYVFDVEQSQETKTYCASRNVVINSSSAIVDGGVYDGSIIVDVQGADVTINGESYSYGDVFNTPGQSTMVISGENDYEEAIHFTINLVVNNLENNGHYTGEVTPTFSGGTIMLNGTSYVSGTKIDKVGNYILTVTGANGFSQTYNFVVEPNELNVTENAEYETGVIPAVADAVMTLNGTSYVSGTAVNTSGNYIFEIVGENGYHKTIHFSLKAGANVVDNAVYEGPILLKFVGAATLNGNDVDSGTTISQVGSYTLVVEDENATNTYHFTIRPVFENFEDGGSYVKTLTPSIENCALLLDGENYVSGNEIDVVGNHVLTVNGVGGFSENYNFTITIDSSQYKNQYFVGGCVVQDIGVVQNVLLDGETYEGANIVQVGIHSVQAFGVNGYSETFMLTIKEEIIVRGVDGIISFVNGQNIDYMASFEIENASLTLDGNAYDSGAEIYGVGLHYLVISGLNDYQENIFFTIVERVVGLTEGGSYDSFVINCENAQKLELNGDVIANNTEITKVGNYSLIVYGTNGYTNNHTFKINLNIHNVSDSSVYNAEIRPIINSDNIILNGNAFNSGDIIDNLGNHTLVIYGAGAYSKTICFKMDCLIVGVENNVEYTTNPTITVTFNEIEVPSTNILLNGNEITSGYVVENIGNYTLRVIGVNSYEKVVSFVVNPTIVGLTNNGVYVGSVTPSIGSGILTLDGDNYISGTTINNVGNHTLVISGENGYLKTISFVVDVTISNYTTGETKVERFTPVFSGVISIGNISLNGQSYVIGTEIVTIGNNLLEVEGVNGYVKNFTIIIVPNLSVIDSQSNVYGKVIFNIDASAVLAIDNASYTSGDEFVLIGYHTLNVTGVNGYNLNKNFALREKDFSISSSYNGVFTATLNNCELRIDDQNYVSNSSYTQPGNHVFSVIGTNSYVSPYSFTLIPTFNIERDAIYENGVEIITLNGGFLLNGAPVLSGASTNEIGINTITCNGSNDYVFEISFTVLPKLTIVNENEEHIYHEEFRMYLQNSAVSIKVDNIVQTSKTYCASQIVGNHTVTIIGLQNYTYSFNIVIEPEITGVVNNGEYSGLVNISVPYAELELDGSIEDEQFYCNIIGHHNLVIKGTNNYIKNIFFTIHPKTIGVENLGHDTPAFYTREISLSVLNGDVYLNANPIAKDAKISQPGKYDLRIDGTNSYSRLYQFDIKPVVSGVINESLYYSEVTPVMSVGTWYLNGKLFTSGTTISDYGNYVLRVTGPEFEQEIIFTIKIDLTNYKTELSRNSKIISNLPFYIDGLRYYSGSLYKTVGNHTLEYRGINNYIEQTNFTIDYEFNGSSETIYEGYFDLNIPNAKIYLNDVEIDNNQKIDSIGNSKIKIVGTNGYEQEIDLHIAANLDCVNGAVYERPFMIKKINAKMYLDGVEIKQDTRVEYNGNHTLVIKGVGDYEEIIEFSYHNNNYGYAIGISSVIGCVIIFAVVLMCMRRRVI